MGDASFVSRLLGMSQVLFPLHDEESLCSDYLQQRLKQPTADHSATPSMFHVQAVQDVKRRHGESSLSASRFASLAIQSFAHSHISGEHNSRAAPRQSEDRQGLVNGDLAPANRGSREAPNVLARPLSSAVSSPQPTYGVVLQPSSILAGESADPGDYTCK